MLNLPSLVVPGKTGKQGKIGKPRLSGIVLPGQHKIKYLLQNCNQPTNELNNIHVMSWNIWKSQQNKDMRTANQIEEIKKNKPGVCCLQEVTAPTLKTFEKLDGYTFYASFPEHIFNNTYCVALLVSDEYKKYICSVSVHQLPSDMSRTAIFVSINIGNSNINIGSVHLESMCNSENVVRRLDQLELLDNLYPGKNVIICGDLNFDRTVECYETNYFKTLEWKVNDTIYPGFQGESPRDSSHVTGNVDIIMYKGNITMTDVLWGGMETIGDTNVHASDHLYQTSIAYI